MKLGRIGVNTASQTSTYHNNCSEANFNYLSNYAFQSKTELRKNMERLQMERDKLYNESQHYKNRCLELMEKLQAYQEKDTPTEIKVLRLAI